MIRMESEQKGSSTLTTTTRDTPFISSRLTESLITPAMIGPSVSNPGPGTIQKINDELTL